MSPLTVAIVAVVTMLGVVLYAWHRVRDMQDDFSWESEPVPVPSYACDPETCIHEWQVERVDSVEMTIDYCSYGGPDPVGIVTYTYYHCPKCGAHDVKESDPVPL